MTDKVYEDISAVVEQHTGLSRVVLEYSLAMKRVVDGAKEPGFSTESWAPLAALVAVDDFERVGNFKEVMSWSDYIGFMTRWAPTAEWNGSFKRVTEHDGVVYLELEERLGSGENVSAVNSLTVYEFDRSGKIRHLDVYLQMPMPAAMPAAYE
jgi:hypothetical protein